MRQRISGMAVLGALLVLTTTPARGGIVLTALEDGSGVIISGGGSADLTDLTFVSTAAEPAGIAPHDPVVLFGSENQHDNLFDAYSGLNSPGTFGPGDFTAPSVGTAETFGIGLNDLLVPPGSGPIAEVSGSMTFDNATFASLGMTPGTYTWTWGTGAHADFFTLQIGTAVPEPSGLALGGTAVVLGGLWTKRRRARSRASAA